MNDEPDDMPEDDGALIEDSFRADEAFIRREKAKAQELRRSQWWKNRCGTGVCHYCGRHFRPSELTMDHLVPISRGGRSTRGNVVPCCKECNTSKHSLLPCEWQAYLDHLAHGTPVVPAPEEGHAS